MQSAHQNLDATDRRILEFLQRNARATYQEIGQAVALSAPQTLRRHRRLEARGFIEGYETRLHPARLGLGIIAFVSICIRRGQLHEARQLPAQVQSIAEVMECYTASGDFDYILKVVTKDLASLSHLLANQLMSLPGVASVRSSVCLNQIKFTSALPLPNPVRN
jgi:Lrp/AsnC family transcriptional regulator, leucine-responsive regulatory protein